MTALRLIALIVVYVSGFVSADEDLFSFNCKIIQDGTTLYKLKKHLFCDYDSGIRPGHGSKNITYIDLAIIVKHITFNKWKASVELNSWIIIEWKDPFLTWNPAEYDDIGSIIIRKNEIWTPDFYSMDPRGGSISGIGNVSCKLKSTGKVACVPLIKYDVPCVSDYTHWPWDVHNCTLRLGTLAYSDEEVTFSNDTLFVIDHYHDRTEWIISRPVNRLKTEQSKLSSNATFPTFTASVLLTRTQTRLKNIFISPVIILTVVTLTILWLRPGSTERLVFCCLNLVGHLLIIRILQWGVPFSGTSVPNILVFYNNSLILSSLVLILSCWLQKLLKSKREVPAWLVSQVSVILTSKVGQVLSINIMDPKGSALLQDDADDNSGLLDSQPKNYNWEDVVTVIGWLLLFTFGFTYFVMCLALLT